MGVLVDSAAEAIAAIVEATQRRATSATTVREPIYVYIYICLFIYVYLYVCMHVCLYIYMYILSRRWEHLHARALQIRAGLSTHIHRETGPPATHTQFLEFSF